MIWHVTHHHELGSGQGGLLGHEVDLWVHGSGEWLDIDKVVMTKYGVDIGMLQDGGGADVMVVADSDAKHPV